MTLRYQLMKPALTLLTFAVVLATSGFEPTAIAQRNMPDWPHLTPQGFGLHIASGDVQHAPWNYKPRDVSGAKSYLQVPFLAVSRRGERVDLFVPEKTGKHDRLPCIVLYYGGGWGGKYTGGLREITQELVARGYVVALPDYVLKAQEPVPTAIWDGAHAIRWLRANAAKYNIDATRIGVWGFSAGGWLVQYMTPSTSSTLYAVTPKEKDRRNEKILVPMLDPHPELEDQPLAVQAVVSDWGCGKYTDARVTDLGADWLGANDPPVFTCHTVKGAVPPGSQAYRDAGGSLELCHLETKSTHVPKGTTPGVDAAGRPTTWHEAVYDFLDRHVKHPRQATAPEAYPAGGPISAPTKVTLRSVYSDGVIHFTTDGSATTRQSPVYREPLTISPGQSLRAIVVNPGLEPSEVASFTFRKATSPQRIIVNARPQYTAHVGKPFEAKLSADGFRIAWSLVGRRGHVIDRKANASESQAWLSINANSGVLSGTPTAPGYNVVIVTAGRGQGERGRVDARRVVVVVEE